MRVKFIFGSYNGIWSEWSEERFWGIEWGRFFRLFFFLIFGVV